MTIDFVNGGQSFQISRTVKKSGQSYYQINDVKCTHDNVVQLLLENGLDIGHNRFLILQGEVESISMMKPAGDDILAEMTKTQLMNLQLLRDVCERIKLDFDPMEYDSILNHVRQTCPPELREQISKFIDIETI